MPITCPFTVIIDTAEQHRFEFKNIKGDSEQDYERFEVPTLLQCLGRHPDSLGDYSLVGGMGRCHIERKSMQDMQSTLLGFADGHRDRFESELANLSKIEAPLVVVECTKEQFILNAPEHGKKTKKENAKILYRSIIAIEQDYRVQVEWSGSREMAELDTFRWLYRFWEKNLKPKRTRKNKTLELPFDLAQEAKQLLDSI